MRNFKIGVYFDLYSNRCSDWEAELARNSVLTPEFYEVMLEYPGGCSTFPSKDIRYLRNLFDVPISVHAPSLNLSLNCANNYINSASRTELLDALRVCSQLSAKSFTIHGGEAPYLLALNNSSAIAQFNNNIPPILLKAKKLGITVCVENLKGTNFPKVLSDIDKILTPNNNLMFALDLRHMCLNKIDPFKAFIRYKSRIKSVHYRIDNGLNTKEMRDFFKLLIRNNYGGLFIVEDASLNSTEKYQKEMMIEGYRYIKMLLKE